jgi:hypothetical protein
MKTTILAMLFALALLGRDHKELNGTWTLVPTKSDFAGQPVMQTGSVTINEREGDITVSRNFAYEGANETYFYKDMSDSRNGASVRSAKDLKSKAKWEHDSLKVVTMQDGKTTTETYTLLPDGTMLATVAKPDGTSFRLYFQRQ